MAITDTIIDILRSWYNGTTSISASVTGPLPLPTGASTSVNQAIEISSLASIDTKLTSPLTVTGPLTDAQLRASDVPVSAASLPLPAGASTSVLQTAGNSSLSSIDSKLPTLGAQVIAGSVAVNIASDQIVLAQSGYEYADTATLTNVTASTSSVTLLSLNTDRKSAIFYNDTNKVCYVKFGTTASATSYTVQLAVNSTLILDAIPVFRGRIDGIWAAGVSGTMRVTELT